MLHLLYYVVCAAMPHLASGYMSKMIAVQFHSFGERFFYNSPLLVVEYLLVRASSRHDHLFYRDWDVN